MHLFKYIFKFTLLFTIFFPLQGQYKYDSLSGINDSIQYLEIDRLKQNLRGVNDRFEKHYNETILRIDSIQKLNSQQEGKISHLENINSNLRKDIGILGEKIEKSISDSQDYRDRMKTVLWIASPIIMLLTIILFIFLFIRIQRNRTEARRMVIGVRNAALDEIRVAEKKIRKETKNKIREERKRERKRQDKRLQNLIRKSVKRIRKRKK